MPLLDSRTAGKLLLRASHRRPGALQFRHGRLVRVVHALHARPVPGDGGRMALLEEPFMQAPGRVAFDLQTLDMPLQRLHGRRDGGGELPAEAAVDEVRARQSSMCIPCGVGVQVVHYRFSTSDHIIQHGCPLRSQPSGNLAGAAFVLGLHSDGGSGMSGIGDEFGVSGAAQQARLIGIRQHGELPCE